jgi:TPP-dependent trihydroxycyclohexane-1,2-dione (THcHDO) dehydratase
MGTVSTYQEELPTHKALNETSMPQSVVVYSKIVRRLAHVLAKVNGSVACGGSL